MMARRYTAQEIVNELLDVVDEDDSEDDFEGYVWLRRNRIWFYSSIALRFYSVSKRHDATRRSAQRHIVNQALQLLVCMQ